MYHKKNPIITTQFEGEAYSKAYNSWRPYEHYHNHFKIAFTVREFGTINVLDEPKDFNFVAMLIEGTPNEIYKSTTEIGMHKCNKKDESEFHPANYAQKHLIHQLFNSSSMYCMDDVDINGYPYNLDLYG
jgi:hypothetical protein